MATWYYVEAGQQAGPVEEAALEEMLRTGRIQPDTLVWHEGMANWQPYREVKPVSAPGAAPPLAAPPVASSALQPGEVVCAECGRIFTKDNAIQYGSLWVCAHCKPLFVQKLQEGVVSGSGRGRRPLPVNAEELVNEITARGVEVDIGSCISRGWGLVKANLGLTIGATVLVMVCIQAGGFIPIIGIVISLVLQGPLMGGLNVFYLKLMRGETATVGDAFCGFSIGFGRLCLTFILMAVLIYVCFAPAAAYAVITGSFSQKGPDALLVILALFGLAGAVYLGVAFVFALPLAADLELGAWDALQVSRRIVSKRWFAVFGLVFLAGLLSALGLLACIIGVLFTLPIFYAATLYAYEDIFGVTPAGT